MVNILKTSKIILAALAISGCASQNNLRLIHQPPMPPVAVAKANPAGPYYHSISLQSVEGAPEFVLLDGNGIINTRPTRRHMLSILAEDLSNADMLAPSRLDSELALYVKVEEIKGPDAVPFSDKLASARVTFRLVNWRTGAVVRQLTEEARYAANFPGVTSGTIRFVIASTVLAAETGAVDATGGTAGYQIDFAVAHGEKTFDRIYWPRLRDNGWTGATGGAEFGAGASFLASLFDEGLIQPAGALKGGYLSDIARSRYATNEVIHLLTDKFLHDLSRDGSIIFKRAVSCQSLNPDKFSFPLSETADAFGVDCPDVHYTSDRLMAVQPSDFS